MPFLCFRSRIFVTACTTVATLTLVTCSACSGITDRAAPNTQQNVHTTNDKIGPRYLYASISPDSGVTQVAEFAIEPDGTLALLDTLLTGRLLRLLTPSPDGHFVFAVNGGLLTTLRVTPGTGKLHIAASTELPTAFDN